MIQRQCNSALCQMHYRDSTPTSNLHGIVVVGHQARRFTTCGVLKTRVVGITEDALDPWQDPCGGHGLVGEVTCNRQDRPSQYFVL